MPNGTPHEEPQLATLPAPAGPADSGYALWAAKRARCCPAKPAVVAVLPPAPGRDHETDLLLWAHYCGATTTGRHGTRSEAAGATVLAEGGQPVTA